jgi:hypothetical protein
MDQGELELLLLLLDGSSFEVADGFVVEFMARLTDVTGERPHGISYAFVLRPMDGGPPWVRFDNAHAVETKRYRRGRAAFDHWHRSSGARGRRYVFTTPNQLLEDFWREVKRTLDEKAIPHDL